MNNNSPNMTSKVFLLGTAIWMLLGILVFLSAMTIYIKVSNDRMEKNISLIQDNLWQIETCLNN